MDNASGAAPAASDDAFLVLREEIQGGVVEQALAFAGAERSNDVGAYGRIVLPPRVGKTVVAAKIISRIEGPAIFLAPRKLLVDQAAEEFARHLPGMPVWRLYHGMREVGDRGIVVATYDTLNSMAKKGGLPPIFGAARLVFADEAHRAMTEIRQGLLQSSFAPAAVRIALTATPDYDEERTLSRYFPHLIHEMTIHEGVGMKLLAPVRTSVFEVDTGNCDVRIVNGEYDPRDVELVMTRIPLLEAIREFRYAEGQKDTPALVCCTTRAQAKRVFEYLAENGPSDVPAPGLVLGDMDDETRRTVLGLYENGGLDTLITVGVLIEGWSSPRCKLLIDAAPGLSQVRAAQKYTRPMTRDGIREARVIALIPAGLRDLPVLPLDVFGPGIEEVYPEERPADSASGPSKDRGPRSLPWERLRSCGIRIRSVQLRLRLVEETLVDQVDINRGVRAVRRIVREQFGRLNASPSTYARFLFARLRVRGVALSGRQLLRYLGFSTHIRGYVRFLARYFPKVAADRLLSVHGHEGAQHVRSFGDRRGDVLRSLGMEHRDDLIPTPQAYADREWLHALERPSGLLTEVRPEALWPLHRECAEDRTAEEALFDRPWPGRLERILSELLPDEQLVLRWRFGFDGEDELTFHEIGSKCGIAHHQARTIYYRALQKLAGRIEAKKIHAVPTADTALQESGWTVREGSSPVALQSLEELQGKLRQLICPRRDKVRWLVWHDDGRLDSTSTFDDAFGGWIGGRAVHVVVRKGPTRILVYSHPLRITPA